MEDLEDLNNHPEPEENVQEDIKEIASRYWNYQMVLSIALVVFSVPLQLKGLQSYIWTVPVVLSLVLSVLAIWTSEALSVNKTKISFIPLIISVMTLIYYWLA